VGFSWDPTDLQAILGDSCGAVLGSLPQYGSFSVPPGHWDMGLRTHSCQGGDFHRPKPIWWDFREMSPGEGSADTGMPFMPKSGPKTWSMLE